MGQEPTPMNRPPSTAGTTTPATDDPEVIRNDIDRTRDEMEGTLEAINDRVNPQRVYQRRSGRMRQRWTALRSSIMGGDRTPDVDMRGSSQHAKQAMSDAPQKMQRRTRGNPLTAGMIAFGIGTLIGSALPETDAERHAARDAANRVDVEGAKQRLTEHAQDIKQNVQEQARDAAQDLKGSAQSAAQDVKGHSQQEGRRVKDDAQQRGEEVRRQS